MLSQWLAAPPAVLLAAALGTALLWAVDSGLVRPAQTEAVNNELRDSEQRFRDLFENANDIIYTLDLEGRVTSLNRRAEEAFGYTIVECLGRSAAEMVPAVYHDRMREALRRKLAGEASPTTYELEIVSKDGRRVRLEVSSRLIVRDGKPVGIQGIARDITERTRVQEALRENEERFRQLADNLPHGFIYQILEDAKGLKRFTYVSGGVEELCGLTPAQATADPAAMYGLIVEEDRPHVHACEKEAFQNHTPFDCQFRQLVRGEVRWLHCRSTPRPLADGWTAWDGIAVDITAQRLAEENVREHAERLRLAIEAGRLGTWDVDLLTGSVQESPRLVEMVGLPPCPGQRRARDWAQCVHPEDLERVRNEFQAAVAGPGKFDSELRVVLPDTTVRWVALRANVVSDDNRRPRRVIGICVDVTERKHLELALRQRADQLVEADRRKDEFMAILGHELRNPLAPLRNALALLSLETETKPAVRDLYAMMERQVKTLARLTDELLDIARVTRGTVELRKETIDLGTLIGRALETCRPYIEQRGHHFTAALSPEPLWLDADPVRIEQVLDNLINNAAKFTEQGGRIALEARREGNSAVLRVRDSGIGIRPESITSLFEPFHQADRLPGRVQEGLGIGLALVRGLVALHGGSVEAHSAGCGQGSEFVVRLPLSQTAPPPDRPVKARNGFSDGPASSHRILIVDDNVDAAQSLAILLRQQGHEVVCAHDGPSALQAADRLRAEFVFLDLGMPGMDGYEVARRLRGHDDYAHACLVAITGYGQEEDRRRTKESGFDCHLVKPVEPADLATLLAAGRMNY